MGRAATPQVTERPPASTPRRPAAGTGADAPAAEPTLSRPPRWRALRGRRTPRSAAGAPRQFLEQGRVRRVALPLLLAVREVEDVRSGGCDDGCSPRHAPCGLARSARTPATTSSGARDALGQHEGVLDRLGGALGLERLHRVGGVAEQRTRPNDQCSSGRRTNTAPRSTSARARSAPAAARPPREAQRLRGRRLERPRLLRPRRVLNRAVHGEQAPADDPVRRRRAGTGRASRVSGRDEIARPPSRGTTPR